MVVLDHIVTLALRVLNILGLARSSEPSALLTAILVLVGLSVKYGPTASAAYSGLLRRR